MDESRITLRVAPQDVEVRRMNNGRYLTMMDIGRFDLSVRAGFTRAILEQRWQPLVRSVTIDFRRSLQVGERYELATKIATFDDRYFYMDQRFYREGAEVAVAFVKAVIRQRGATLAPSKVLAAIGYHDPAPPMPRALASWTASLAELRRATAT